MKIMTILLNRLPGRPKKPKPLSPGVYKGQVKNVVVDELTGRMVIQFEATEKQLNR